MSDSSPTTDEDGTDNEPVVQPVGDTPSRAELEDYPFDTADRLFARALLRFDQKVERFGSGQGWRDDAAADMADAAIRKLHEAREHIEAGEDQQAETALADALNYGLFTADSMQHGGNDA